MVTKDILSPCGPNVINPGDNGEDSFDAGYSRKVISAMSHELFSSIAAISSNIQLFRRFRYDMDQTVRDECFSLCDDSVKDIFRFLDNVQLLNAINKSGIKLEKVPLNLRKFIYQLCKDPVLVNLDSSRILLKWNLNDRIVLCDKRALTRVLIHSIGNALKFSRDPVRVVVSASNYELSVIVQDYGIGIPEEQIEQVFQPFYRASNVGHISGVGLGLAIVYSLVQKLDGKIRMSSAIGEGVTIQMNIPYGLSTKDSVN